MLNESPQWDATLSYLSIQCKPDNLSGNHLSLSLSLWILFTDADIYDGIDLLALRGSGGWEGVYSISISIGIVFMNTQICMMA